jgi:hypothetical protein
MNKFKRADYYGTEQNTNVSFLEFGSIDIKNAKRTTWAYKQDQEAYDLYMFSRYARDLLSFREFCIEFAASGGKRGNLAALNDVVINSAHDKMLDYLFKYAGLITTVQSGAASRVCESGSSLYGLIDEAIAFDNVLFDGKHTDGIKSLKYLASDISNFFNTGAKVFHPDIDITSSLAPTIGDLMNETEKLSLFYGLGVSMRYSLRDAADIGKLSKKAELSVFNRLSVTKGNVNLQYVYGSGKNVYVISLARMLDILSGDGVAAKYCSSNMQKDKDGKDTLRASIIMSKDISKLESFIKNYNSCVNKCLGIDGVYEGEWKDLCQLIEE